MIYKVDLVSLMSKCLGINYSLEYACGPVSCEKFILSLNDKQIMDVADFCERVENEYCFLFGTNNFHENKCIVTRKVSDIFYSIWDKCNTAFSSSVKLTHGYISEEIRCNFALIKIVKDVIRDMFYEKDSEQTIKENPCLNLCHFGFWSVYSLIVEISSYNLDISECTEIIKDLWYDVETCIDLDIELCGDGKEEFIFGLYLLYRYARLSANELDELNSIYGNRRLSFGQFLEELRNYSNDIKMLIDINSIKKEPA